VMNGAFYVAASVAVVATVLMVTRANVMHALLYLVVSLIATAVMFLALGAAFLAALEVIVYAGAVMVLFIFVVMMLNLGPGTREGTFARPAAWAGPVVLVAILGVELLYVFASGAAASVTASATSPSEVAASLFSTYLVAVELASVLLMAALVGAHHLGRREDEGEPS
jgi:NADH-quinone oxidoreductase subunit J